MSNKPKTQHCPRCSGTGLEETAIGCRRCRKCYGKGRVPIEHTSALGARKANGNRPQGRPGEISPDAGNRIISEPGDFSVVKRPLDLSNRKLIAVSGDRYLEETSPGQGRVIIPSENYEGPVHSIASIAARGYWEPIEAEEVKRIVEKVLNETTFHSKEVQMNDRDKRMTVVMGELTALLKKRDAKQVELGKLEKQIEAKQVELSRALPKAQQAPKPVVKPQPPTT